MVAAYGDENTFVSFCLHNVAHDCKTIIVAYCMHDQTTYLSKERKKKSIKQMFDLVPSTVAVQFKWYLQSSIEMNKHD